jgi:hypothetical protein
VVRGWLLFNCSRGMLGDGAFLLGSFATAALQAAGMGRADIPEDQRVPFTLFIDEVQNVRTDELEMWLAEARKFRLRLVIAHQYLGQLGKELQEAVFSNCGTSIVFAVSPQDAAAIQRRLPVDMPIERTLTQQGIGQALVCQRGKPPVHTRILPVYTPDVRLDVLSEFAAGLRERHGRPLAAVEAEIRARGTTPRPRPVAPASLPTAPEPAPPPSPPPPADLAAPPASSKRRGPRPPRSSGRPIVEAADD